MDTSDTSFRSYLINAQISRIVSHSIGLIGCLLVLYYELKHRRTISTNDKLKQKWLLLWAMLTILSATSNRLLDITYALPYICQYTAHLTLFLWFSKLIFLGLFQIQRLQFLFLQNNIDNNVTLPLMFKLLYLGAVMSSGVAISFLFAITVNDYHQYGCLWTYNHFGTVINFVWIFVYLCWDGSTLIVYILKLYRYRKTETAGMYNRITLILSKVILLTLIYEVTTSIVAILAFIVQVTHNEYVVIIFYAVGSVDTFIVGFMVYLMQKHNENHYWAFISLLDKVHLTFCCKRLSRDANQRINANTAEQTWNPTGNTVVDTSGLQSSGISAS